MKQNFTKFGMLMAMLLAFLPASAYDFEVDGIYYEVVSLSDLTCKVVAGDNKYEGEVVIPAEVIYNNRILKVIEIGENAFSRCSLLTLVTIPESVSEIGRGAFSKCRSLTSIKIPDSVTKIGSSAFADCSTLTSISIPESVTEIGRNFVSEGVFENCSSLTSITIDASVNEIDKYMFSGCYAISSISIGNSVRKIGESAFENREALTSVMIGTSVTEIGKSAFEGCSSLSSVTIPELVIAIGEVAFRGCRSLTSITIPDLVTEIGFGAFSQCISLTSVKLGNSVTKIAGSAFENCSSLVSIIMPNTTTNIGYNVFCNCTALKNITLSEKLKGIPRGSFTNCMSISALTIPGSISRIEEYNQYYANGIQREYYTFKGCEKLKEILFKYGKETLDTGYSSSNIGFINSWGSWTKRLEKVFIDRVLTSPLPMPNVKDLTVGEHLITLQISNCDNLENIVSYAMIPPAVPSGFTNSQYMNIIVKVPNEALVAYQKDSVWGGFWNLQGFDASKVEDIEIDSVDKTVVGRYDLNGRAVNEDYKGIAIVRFSDGSTMKVVL